MRLKRIACGAVALAALMGGLTACGDDKDEPVALTVKATSSGEKFAFDMPKEMDGGVVDLTLDNQDSQPHEIGLVRVKDGTTQKDVHDELLASDEGAPVPDFILGVAGVGFAAPSQTATASQDLAEGTYVYFCTFGEDEGVHYDNGMLGTVEVKNEKGKGDLPEADQSITATEYSFDIDGLTAGTHKLKFTNDGKQLHHAVMFPVAEGATLDQAKAFFATDDEPEGPPPVDFESGTNTIVLGGGQEQVVDVTLQKGDYVVICFMTDKEGGPPHVAKGMIGEATVE